MQLRDQIIAVFQEVAEEQSKTLAPLSEKLGLFETGLDSLCFAIIVARLEDRLGSDPFSSNEDAGFPVTFGDFVKFYETAFPDAAA